MIALLVLAGISWGTCGAAAVPSPRADAMPAASEVRVPSADRELPSFPVRGDTLHLTLADAIGRALVHSPRLAAAQSAHRGAGASARGAAAAGLPSVDLTAGYTRLSDVPAFDLTLPGGRDVAIAPNIPNAWLFRAEASVPLYTGGRIASAASAARREMDASGSDLEAVRADLILEVMTAYWNLSTQRESAAVLAQGLSAYDAHLEDARHRAGVGLAARDEVLAIEVERDRAELGRVQADGAAAVAVENLRRLLVTDESAAIELASEPEAQAPPDTVAGAAARIDVLVAAALASRPERTALAARRAAAEDRVRVQRGARWPQVIAATGYDYANPNRRITPPSETWKETWDASLKLQLPIFDSGRISAATDRARADAAVLAQQAADLDRRIRLEVTSWFIECTNAETAVAVSERAVEAARDYERVTRDRYREGVAASSDLLDAEVAGLRAALDRTQARAHLLLARANLDRSVGRLR